MKRNARIRMTGMGALLLFIMASFFCSKTPIDRATALLEKLKSPDENIRSQAARDLGDFSEQRVRDALLLAALDPSTRVRAGVFRSLGTLKCRDGLMVLIAGLKDRSRDLRRTAAQALGLIGDKRAVEPLIATLGDPEADVRDEAICALGKFHDAQALDALLSLSDAQSSNGMVYYGALGESGDTRVIFRIIDDVKRSRIDVEGSAALGKIGAPAFAALVNELHRTEFEVRGRLIRCFINCGPGAVRYLMGLAGNGTDVERKMSGLVLSWAGEWYREDPILGEIEALLKAAMLDRNLPFVAGASSFFIREGASGSEEILIEALNRHGDREMANGFLNCGNERLAQAAMRWSRRHGYSVINAPGAVISQWGRKG